MVTKKGWLEQRSRERSSATVNVLFRVLDGPEKHGLLDHSKYKTTTLNHLPKLAQKFHVYQAVTKDLAEGNLSVTGEHSFAVEELVEISILPPKYVVPVTLLANVKWTRSFSQLGKTLSTAGITVVALDSESMDRLSRHFLADKLRRESKN
jgi:hypothetical protein